MGIPQTNSQWDIIIKPVSRFDGFHLKELLAYRDLIVLFVRRDFVAQYKQTILGPLWYLIQPLLMTLVFTVIFGKVVQISTDQIPQPLFYLAGLTLWGLFQSTFIEISNIFINNAHLFGKVYFPRMVMPIAATLSRYVTFAIQFVLFIALFLYYVVTSTKVHPNLALLFLPLILLQSSLLALGCGLLITAVTVKYRDLRHLISFGTQLWMYATPIVYPLSEVPNDYRWIMVLNPMAHSVALFRDGFFGTRSGNPVYFAAAFAGTLGLVLLGIAAYTRAEKTFIDRV